MLVRVLIVAIVALFLVLWVRAVIDVFRRPDLTPGAPSGVDDRHARAAVRRPARLHDDAAHGRDAPPRLTPSRRALGSPRGRADREPRPAATARFDDIDDLVASHDDDPASFAPPATAGANNCASRSSVRPTLEDGGFLHLAIEADGRLVGDIQARAPQNGFPPGVCEIGITLFRRRQGPRRRA